MWACVPSVLAVLGTSSLEWPLKFLLGDWLVELGHVCLL